MESKHEHVRIHIPDWFKAIAFLVLLFVLYRFTSVIINTVLLFMIGGILAYIFHPFVNWLGKRGVSRGLAVVLVFAVLSLLLGLFIYLVTPPVVREVGNFSRNMPQVISKAEREYSNLRGKLPPAIQKSLPPNVGSLIKSATEYLTSQSQKALSVVPSIVSAVTGTVVAVIFAIYILVYLDEIDSWFRLLIPEEHHWLYDHFVAYLDVGYGKYVVGQIIVSVTYGIAVGATAAAFGLPFAVLLGLWAGIIQIIPIIGPVIAIIPAIALAFIISIKTGIALTVILLLITGAQGVFITPYILGAAVTISPILILFFIIAGGEIGGIGGTILAVPLLVALNLIWQFIQENIIYHPAAPPERPPTTLTVPRRPRKPASKWRRYLGREQDEENEEGSEPSGEKPEEPGKKPEVPDEGSNEDKDTGKDTGEDGGPEKPEQ